MRDLELGEHGLSWTHAPDVLTHLLPDGRAATVNRDVETTMASMEQFAAGDGERWLHARAQVITDTDGHAERIIGLLSDVTERRYREEAPADRGIEQML